MAEQAKILEEFKNEFRIGCSLEEGAVALSNSLKIKMARCKIKNKKPKEAERLCLEVIGT